MNKMKSKIAMNLAIELEIVVISFHVKDYALKHVILVNWMFLSL